MEFIKLNERTLAFDEKQMVKSLFHEKVLHLAWELHATWKWRLLMTRDLYSEFFRLITSAACAKVRSQRSFPLTPIFGPSRYPQGGDVSGFKNRLSGGGYVLNVHFFFSGNAIPFLQGKTRKRSDEWANILSFLGSQLFQMLGISDIQLIRIVFIF